MNINWWTADAGQDACLNLEGRLVQRQYELASQRPARYATNASWRDGAISTDLLRKSVLWGLSH